MQVLSAKYEISKDTLKITLTGEIDHHTAKSVRADIDEQIYKNAGKTVLIDLKDVAFMDSSGLGLILGRYTHVKDAGGVLKVLNPTGSAQRVLNLAGAEKLIPILYTDKNGQ